MDLEDYASPGLEAKITLTPQETTALGTISSGWGLQVLGTYFKKTNRGRKASDEVDSLEGYRQELADAIAVLQRLGDRLAAGKEA